MRFWLFLFLVACESPVASQTAAPDASAGGGGGGGGGGGIDGDAPLDNLGFAQHFVSNLTLGANIERGFAWTVPEAYWTYLHDTVHLTHVRLFYPWRPSIAMGGGGPNNERPDHDRFARILDAADAAMAAGLTVFLDCTDVLGTEDFETNEVFDHVASCGDWVAERNFDPRKIAVGAVNEWAGGDDNTVYNELRQQMHDLLRQRLPTFVLTTGPAYWKSRDYLYDEAKQFWLFEDMRVIYEWHHYSSLDAAGWREEEQKLAAWRAAHANRPTICGEAGPGYWDEPVNGSRLASVPDVWPDRFGEMLPEIAAERPSLWAITYGGDFRLNASSDDPTLQPAMQQMFIDNEAAIRAKLGL